MTRSKKFLLSISSGILLSLGWPPFPFFPLLFIGFIPILWLDDVCSESKKSARSFFWYSYLALLIWNFGTTWWVGATYFGTHDISTAIAGLLANILNPLLMSIPMVAFHNTKKRFGATWGYISLPAYWITFEFLHLRWDLSWPWLTLGNGLACFPQLIQWYQFRSEEHTSELQSRGLISYAVFCLTNTRKEELLIEEGELAKVHLLRYVLAA